MCMAWKQGHLLNNFRFLDLDEIAISETKYSGKHALASIFEDYIFPSCGLSGAIGGVVVLLRELFDL